MAVLALVAVAVGGAVTSAQEGDGPIGTFLAKVAEKLGVSEDELKDAIDEARVETIDEAVAEGRLTEEQAERLKEHTWDGGFLFGGPLPGMKRQLGLHFYSLEAAVEVLGITRDDLSEQAKDGKSLAEIAESQGMSVEDFQAALLTEVKAHLDDLVAQGDLTQENADLIFQAAEDNIEQIVSGELGPHGLGRFRGLGDGPGRLGRPCWSDPPSDDTSGSTQSTGVAAY